MNIRVARSYVAEVALEVLHVHDVEAHDGRIQPNIGFSELLSEIVRARGGEIGLRAVEGLEQLGHSGLIRLSLGAEAGLVHAIVDVVVSPFVGLIDLFLQCWREKIDGSFVFGEHVVKFVVEHADDLTGFVADDGLLLDVIEARHRESAAIVGLRREVYVAEMRELWVNGVGMNVFARQLFIRSHEAPSFALNQPNPNRMSTAAIPFSPICQWTEVNGMISSRPFNFLTIKVR